MLYRFAVVVGALALFWSAHPAHAAGPTTSPVETREQKDARMQWWREARFGMFIHWGIYSVPAGVYNGRNIDSIGEWIMNNASIPVADYAKFAGQFNPVKFSADDFVATAKSAGMKYIVITAKHHDGFAMFKSSDPFNIVDATPFHRDVIKELAGAAQKQGIRFGVYYSQSQDWHHPGGYAYGRQGRKNGTHWDPAQDGSFDDYVNNVAVPQVRELLTNIQPDILWWDTPGDITLAEATRLHDLLKLQPNIITNNRLMNTRTPGAFIGDTETPEQTIPATGYPGGRDWESCMTINDTWGYKSTDTNFKSAQTLIRNLIDCASKGGNYLLNVGPTAEGIIPQPERDRLATMGKWLEINGEAIYGTGPNPFPARAPTTQSATTTSATARGRPAPAVVWDWRATTKPGKIYLHIFQWPVNQTFTIPAPASIVSKAYLVADPSRASLPTRETTGAIDGPGGTAAADSAHPLFQITVPKNPPDPIASVICLELARQ
jgi:alpha-L-fucosidase